MTRRRIAQRLPSLALALSVSTAVVVAASSPHRAEAFEGCRALIERLKHDAPIWKREHGDDGVSWVGLGP